MSSPRRYTILVPQETVDRASAYIDALCEDPTVAGAKLRPALDRTDPEDLAPYDLLGALFDTKQPQIFAESEVAGDGSDWNLDELGLLGDVSVAVPVTIFDDGRHQHPTPHDPPFEGMLVFTSGALLRNGRGCEPADWAEVVVSDQTLSPEALYQLYRRRLTPVLRHIDEHAARPRSAIVTIPGLGCGQFAGPFRGQLGAHLQRTLERLLQDIGASLPNLRAVYFDPYDECADARTEIHGISLMVRPLRSPGNAHKPQLCRPTAYQDADDDFFAGSRLTADGVKAAATDSMRAMTGVEGRYDAAAAMYRPPPPFRTWDEVVKDGMRRRGLRLWDL